MALSIPTALLKLSPPPPPARTLRRLPISLPSSTTAMFTPRSRAQTMLPPLTALSPQELAALPATLADFVLASPPTWESAFSSNLIIFLAGSPLLLSGLSAAGFGAAFLLGTLTWRAFGTPGFLLVAAYFVLRAKEFWDFGAGEFNSASMVDSASKESSVSGEEGTILHGHVGRPAHGTAATKLKISQKEALGVAEKRRGRRGPGSVIGSSAAGCVCALLSIYGIGGVAYAGLWQLGFVASFCTKLSDTVSSEIGKAYGKTTYLVTTLKVVPRGTEGAVSVEGTIAGLLAAILLASVAYSMGEIDVPQAVICVLASQIANFGESLIGAQLQEKKGFQWLNNDVVNVINISIGSILAVLQQLMLDTMYR